MKWPVIPAVDLQKLCFGYLPEAITFYPALTGWRALRFLARLKGVAPEDARPLLELVGLSKAANARIKTYSKGMRQRLGLAQALLGNPQLLLLDEPTNGLDPQGIQEFYAILETLQQAKQVAILTASHLLTEIESRLDHLYLLKDGQFEKSGTVKDLIEEAGLPVGIRLVLKDSQQHLSPLLERLGAHISRNGHPHTYDIECSPAAKLDVLHALFRHRDDLESLTIVEPGLEAVFHHYQATGSTRFSPINPNSHEADAS